MDLQTQLVDRRWIDVAAPPDDVFAEVERLGGVAGWPSANLLWRIRGQIDIWVGGVGLRRGRRDQERLELGDHLDFWRVEDIERPRRLRLRAEMRLPGKAWLLYEVEPREEGSRLIQSAILDPDGIAGYAYWYGLLPVHLPIFRGMIRKLRDRAMRRHAGTARARTSEM